MPLCGIWSRPCLIVSEMAAWWTSLSLILMSPSPPRPHCEVQKSSQTRLAHTTKWNNLVKIQVRGGWLVLPSYIPQQRNGIDMTVLKVRKQLAQDRVLSMRCPCQEMLSATCSTSSPGVWRTAGAPRLADLESMPRGLEPSQHSLLLLLLELLELLDQETQGRVPLALLVGG